MKYSFLPLFIIIFSIISCGKEKFATKKVLNRYDAPLSEIMKFEGKGWSDFGTVKPKVDFLFLWDNSSSYLHTSTETKKALASTIGQISDNFDFRIILSPLIPTKTEREKYLLESWIAYMPGEKVDLNDEGLYTRFREVDAGDWAMFNLVPSGTLEAGVSRAYDLATLGYEKGIFRPNAHMIIVLLSNGDDNSWAKNLGYYSGIAWLNYVINWTEEFAKLKNLKTLKNLRFLSVVPHTNCEGSKKGSTYIKMSANLSGGLTTDSFDFCSIQSFYRLFNGINEAITLVIVPFTYNYWPIKTDQYGGFNPDKVTVAVRNSKGEFIKNLNQSKLEGGKWSDGWRFIGFQSNLDLIECPINPITKKPYPEINCGSEKYTGNVIQLIGNAKITYPDYIDVYTETQVEYFGYVRMNFKPFIDPNKNLSDSIRVKINGIQVPEGGFEYIPERTTRNIKIKGPGDFTEGVDPKREFEGYFLKLAPNWIYKSNESVQVDYWPAGT